MGRPRLKVVKQNGGLGRRTPSAIMNTGAVISAVATTTMTLGKIYELKSIQDAEFLGINEAYDIANKVLVYHRLNRLFFRNPSITVYFMPVAQTVTLSQMVDKDNNYMAKVLRDQKGEIRQAFVAFNPAADYALTLLDGFDQEVITAVTLAQDLANQEFKKDRYASIFIEGRNFSGTATAAKDFRNLDTAAPDVSVVAFADQAIIDNDTYPDGYAAVEDVVGLLSKAAVSQNAGELTDEFNLTDEAENVFLNAGLSSGISISDYNDTDLDTLNDKGIIIATSTSGIAGLHITDMHTCDTLDSDYAYVENVRTINEMIRSARKVLLPRIKGRLLVDPDTGKMAPTTAKEMERSVIDSQNQLIQDGDLSGGVDAFIDPDQDILATSRFEVKLTAVPVAIGRQITLNIGFNNPKNA